MYSINPLPCNVLITPDEMNRMFEYNSIDPNIFMAAIQIAEQQFVVPILGYNFYRDFINQKNVVVTSGNIAALQVYFTPRNITLELGCIVNAIELITVSPENALLWNSVLWKYIYECVMFVALPENYAKFTSSGIQINNPNPSFIDGSAQGNSAGVSLQGLKYLRDNRLLNRVSVMSDALEQFLCANYRSYPLYPTPYKWDKGVKVESRKSGFVDIYADDEDCANWGHHSTPVPTPVPAPRTLSCSMIINIVASPNPSNTYTLCNMQTIARDYPAGNTLTIPHLIGKVVNPTIYIDSSPNVIIMDTATGTFDNTAGGGFNVNTDGPPTTIVITYNEIVNG